MIEKIQRIWSKVIDFLTERSTFTSSAILLAVCIALEFYHQIGGKH